MGYGQTVVNQLVMVDLLENNDKYNESTKVQTLAASTTIDKTCSFMPSCETWAFPSSC